MSIQVMVLKLQRFFFKNYSYLVFDSLRKNSVIIDPSWQVSRIIQQLESHQLKPLAILLTHSHYDHICGVNGLVKQYNLPVYISQIEQQFYDFHTANLRCIVDEASFTIGDLVINPIFTPGHTKGGLCYLIENNIFTGDTVFIEGCGVCWAKGGDAQELFHSIQKLKQLVPQNSHIYPGHSYGSEPGALFASLWKNNIYFQFDKPNDFVNFRERKNQRSPFNFQ